MQKVLRRATLLGTPQGAQRPTPRSQVAAVSDLGPVPRRWPRAALSQREVP